MLLETPGVEATAPMLGGVWGAALHDLDPAAYAAVFAPNDPRDGSPRRDRPRFDLRRYSGRQRAELEPRGVSGFLELPRGPDPLPPCSSPPSRSILEKSP